MRYPAPPHAILFPPALMTVIYDTGGAGEPIQWGELHNRGRAASAASKPERGSAWIKP